MVKKDQFPGLIAVNPQVAETEDAEYAARTLVQAELAERILWLRLV